MWIQRGTFCPSDVSLEEKKTAKASKNAKTVKAPSAKGLKVWLHGKEDDEKAAQVSERKKGNKAMMSEHNSSAHKP